jgi:hypothetical protein
MLMLEPVRVRAPSCANLSPAVVAWYVTYGCACVMFALVHHTRVWRPEARRGRARRAGRGELCGEQLPVRRMCSDVAGRLKRVGSTLRRR